jgi:hypothetical protein
VPAVSEASVNEGHTARIDRRNIDNNFVNTIEIIHVSLIMSYINKPYCYD